MEETSTNWWWVQLTGLRRKFGFRKGGGLTTAERSFCTETTRHGLRHSGRYAGGARGKRSCGRLKMRKNRRCMRKNLRGGKKTSKGETNHKKHISRDLLNSGSSTQTGQETRCDSSSKRLFTRKKKKRAHILLHKVIEGPVEGGGLQTGILRGGRNGKKRKSRRKLNTSECSFTCTTEGGNMGETAQFLAGAMLNSGPSIKNCRRYCEGERRTNKAKKESF